MPFASQNTAAITLPADGCVLNFFSLGDPGPTHWQLLSFILWLIIMNPSLIYSHQTQKKISFDLKGFNKALHTNALVAICSSLRDLGTQQLLACAYLNDHVRLLKCYHVKCLMPVLFLPPEFAYQSISDPELSYTFLRRWHPAGVQTSLHLLKTFYRVWIPLPRL